MNVVKSVLTGLVAGVLALVLWTVWRDCVCPGFRRRFPLDVETIDQKADGMTLST